MTATLFFYILLTSVKPRKNEELTILFSIEPFKFNAIELLKTLKSEVFLHNTDVFMASYFLKVFKVLFSLTLQKRLHECVTTVCRGVEQRSCSSAAFSAIWHRHSLMYCYVTSIGACAQLESTSFSVCVCVCVCVCVKSKLVPQLEFSFGSCIFAGVSSSSSMIVFALCVCLGVCVPLINKGSCLSSALSAQRNQQ